MCQHKACVARKFGLGHNMLYVKMKGVGVMSMPSFPRADVILSRDEAVNAIITSIAVEEMALSRVIEAESEKIKFVIECAKKRGCLKDDMLIILEVNKSVRELFDSITQMQIVLKEKLSLVKGYFPQPSPHPCPPPVPPCPPSPCHCTSVFRALTDRAWCINKNLKLFEQRHCKGGANLVLDGCESLILLPPKSIFKIEIDIELKRKFGCVSVVEVELKKGCGGVVRRERITSKMRNCRVYLAHSFIFETPHQCEDIYVSAILRSPEHVEVISGKILTTKL